MNNHDFFYASSVTLLKSRYIPQSRIIRIVIETFLKAYDYIIFISKMVGHMQQLYFALH